MISLLLLAAEPALAWKHTFFVWDDRDIPIAWWMDDDVEDSLPEGYPLEVAQEAWNGWYEATCAAIGDDFQEVAPMGDPGSDGKYAFYWDDPTDRVEVGVLGVTYSYPSSTRRVISGQTYFLFADADIIFNDNVDFGSTQEIQDGNCNGQTAIEGVATHEVGHSWGLGHSCEQGDACTEQTLRDATMYWSVGPCDLAQNEINADDIQSITALYGPYGSFAATSPRSGAAPLEVDFQISSDTEVVGATWDFGDGTDPSTGTAPSHVYEKKGQFTVSVDMELSDPTCGSFTYQSSELGYITVCEPPAPEPGAEGYFSLETIDGMTVQTVNHTDVSVYGCIDTIEWQLYKGSGPEAITGEPVQRVGAWSPKLAFPEAGSWVVVMNVGGPGGMDASYLVVDAKEGGAGGCSTVSPFAGGVGAMLLAAAAGLRRRRA
jgi:hypothetical protein